MILPKMTKVKSKVGLLKQKNIDLENKNLHVKTIAEACEICASKTLKLHCKIICYNCHLYIISLFIFIKNDTKGVVIKLDCWDISKV